MTLKSKIPFPLVLGSALIVPKEAKTNPPSIDCSLHRWWRATTRSEPPFTLKRDRIRQFWKYIRNLRKAIPSGRVTEDRSRCSGANTLVWCCSESDLCNNRVMLYSSSLSQDCFPVPDDVLVLDAIWTYLEDTWAASCGWVWVVWKWKCLSYLFPLTMSFWPKTVRSTFGISLWISSEAMRKAAQNCAASQDMNLTEGASSHVALHIHLKLSLFQRRSDRVREFDGEAFLWLVAKTRTACSRECNQTARKHRTVLLKFDRTVTTSQVGIGISIRSRGIWKEECNRNCAATIRTYLENDHVICQEWSRGLHVIVGLSPEMGANIH